MSKTEITTDVHFKLREPFPAEAIGKLPKFTCRLCKDARTKVCSQHSKSRCPECNNYITGAHIHVDYVGHADVTGRLLSVDTGWNWEPVGTDSDGFPLRDQFGGLWIRLTVAGVTRLGYGDADGKPGADGIKQAIGDAIRNAAMRFGVALDLWGATFKQDESNIDHTPVDPGPPSLSALKQIALTARDQAINPATGAATLRETWRHLRRAGADTIPVTNENGDEEAAGDLVHRIGQERSEPTEVAA